MKNGIIIIFLFALGFTVGCANLDPWGELDAVPKSSSHPFDAETKVTTKPEADEAAKPGIELAGQTLDLGQCVTVALEHNPRTTETWHAIRAAAARRGSSKADYLPTIGFTSSVARGKTVQLDRETEPSTRTRHEGVFGLRWLLFDGGGRASRVDAATAELLAAGFRHNAALQDVTLAVMESYYSLLAAHSFQQLAEETVRQHDYQLRLARARHEAGVARKSDILRAETEKADAKLVRVRADNKIQQARGQLVSAMGLPVSTYFEIAALPEIQYKQQLNEVRDALREAADKRPELQAALAQVRSREAAERMAESRYWPTIAVDTGLGWIDEQFPPNQKEWNLGVALDMPLFTGFDRNYQLHSSRAELEAALANHQIVLQGVELDIWTAYWQTIEAGKAIEAAEQFVASAEESARVAEGEYKSGTGSIIGVIDSQAARTAARDRLIQARLDWRTAKARFEHAAGRLKNWNNDE